MTPEKLQKGAKSWLFLNQNCPIRPHRHFCLSKVTQRALIGQKSKQTKGNSCISCYFPVSLKQALHAAESDVAKKPNLNKSTNCANQREAGQRYELLVSSSEPSNDFRNPESDKNFPTLNTKDKNRFKVRYLTKIRLPLTNKNVRSPNDLALAGQNMTGTDDDKPQKRGQKNRGHKNLRQKSKSSKSSSDKPEAETKIHRCDEKRRQSIGSQETTRRRNPKAPLGRPVDSQQNPSQEKSEK